MGTNNIITVELLTRLLPKASAPQALKWAAPLQYACDKFEINSPVRVAMFLAQVIHESAYLGAVEENLNYRADRLVSVFPKYFHSLQDALNVAGKPDAIARKIYGGRMGNDPAPSNDGYSYRGRGLIQLTGKKNYKAAGDALKLNLVDHPGLVCEPSYAALTAAWVFSSFGCNKAADNRDIEGCTKLINGGLNGMTDRRAIWFKALSVLGLPTS